jgi:EAL domain-containing protein (putative c-di-GMP-specific phosphodiesterase class I)
MARSLDIEVLAERVENQLEKSVLRAAGISLFQGYHFAKPTLMALPVVSSLVQAVEARTSGQDLAPARGREPQRGMGGRS